MKTIDAKGLLCPQPLIMTKRAMKEMAALEEMTILCDNATSLKNVMTFLLDQGAKPQSEKLDGGVFQIKAINPADFNKEVDETAYCVSGNTDKSYVVVLKSDKMGDGDDVLGLMLMKAFVNSLHEQDELPTHVVMYNAGVKLAAKNSDVLKALVSLEDAGVRILVCGTCIDYYKIQDDLGVGMISNMYTITETLVQAGHIMSV